MIDSSCEATGDEETFCKGNPKCGKVFGRMVIQVIDVPNNYAVIDLDKPLAEKATDTSTAHDHLEVRNDKSLGGKHEGFTIL